MNRIRSIKLIPQILLGLAALACGAMSASAQQGIVRHGSVNATSIPRADDVLFTLAAWNASSALGTFDLETITFPGGTDGLTIRGDVSVVPEPSTALLFALGLGGLASIRRRDERRGH